MATWPKFATKSQGQQIRLTAHADPKRDISFDDYADVTRCVPSLDGAQKTSLAPQCSNLKHFGSKFTVWKKGIATLLGLVGARSIVAPLVRPCSSQRKHVTVPERRWLLNTTLFENTKASIQQRCQTARYRGTRAGVYRWLPRSANLAVLWAACRGLFANEKRAFSRLPPRIWRLSTLPGPRWAIAWACPTQCSSFISDFFYQFHASLHDMSAAKLSRKRFQSEGSNQNIDFASSILCANCLSYKPSAQIVYRNT